MPSKPKTANLHRSKRKVNRQAKNRQRRRALPTNSKAWRSIRADVLAGEPLCRHCARDGKTTAATDVDHIDDDATNNDPANLQPLCRRCHSVKTVADQGGRVGNLKGVRDDSTALQKNAYADK